MFYTLNSKLLQHFGYKSAFYTLVLCVVSEMRIVYSLFVFVAQKRGRNNALVLFLGKSFLLFMKQQNSH